MAGKQRTKPKAEDRRGGSRSRSPGRTVGSGSLSLRNWESLKSDLVREIRTSERLTREDLAVRINAKG